MISADLRKKNALVTGGSSGLGLAVTNLFTELGCTVAINDIPGSERLRHEVDRLRDDGHDVYAAPGDLRDPADTSNMVNKAAEDMGGIDYLINNAGHPVTLKAIPASDLKAQTEELWNEILSINLIASFRTAKAAEPYLRASKGAIVNTSSMAGVRGGGSSSPYSVAKGGVIVLTKELARGLSPDVRVNAIAPMYVDPNDTSFPLRWDTVYEDAVVLPIPRPGTGREYAEVTLFLCCSASYMTGVTLHVDGGYNA